MRVYYPDRYDPYGDLSSDGGSRLRRLLMAAESRFGAAATDRLPLGKLLDVGCGSGTYMASMARRGFEVHGVEISSYASQRASSKSLRTITGDFLVVELPSEEFDIVTMNHFLEHSVDPQQSLLKAWRILRPGGHLVVGVPNFSSWLSRRFGSDWSDLDLPRHAFHFSRHGLTRLLVKSGFRVDCVRGVVGAESGSFVTSVLVRAGIRGSSFGDFIYPLLHVLCYPFGVPFILSRRGAWIRVFSTKV